jgi:hypothetical protein
MLTEEKERTLNIRPITLLVLFVCLIGLSASATYLMVSVKYQSQLDNKNQQVLAFQENNKALADQNIELKNSLQKLEGEYSRLDAQLSQIEAQKADRQTSEQKPNEFKEVPILKPTWVASGGTTLAFDGNLRIVIHKASDNDECPSNSAAAGYLTGHTETKKLCLRTGMPENFTYQGKNYLFNLSGIAAEAGVYRYCISISLEQ